MMVGSWASESVAQGGGGAVVHAAAGASVHGQGVHVVGQGAQHRQAHAKTRFWVAIL